MTMAERTCEREGKDKNLLSAVQQTTYNNINVPESQDWVEVAKPKNNVW